MSYPSSYIKFIPEDHTHYKTFMIHVFGIRQTVSCKAGITLGYFTDNSPASSVAAFKLTLSNYNGE